MTQIQPDLLLNDTPNDGTTDTTGKTKMKMKTSNSAQTTRPALDALQVAVDEHDPISEHTDKLKANISGWLADQKAIAADRTGDPSKLAKKTITLENKIGEAKAEIAITQSRLMAAADSVESHISDAAQEFRRLEREADNEIRDAAQKILDDPVVLESISKLKAALHARGDSHEIMNNLRLSNNFAGNHPEDFEKYGHKPEYPSGKSLLNRAASIRHANRKLKETIKQVSA